MTEVQITDADYQRVMDAIRAEAIEPPSVLFTVTASDEQWLAWVRRALARLRDA